MLLLVVSAFGREAAGQVPDPGAAILTALQELQPRLERSTADPEDAVAGVLDLLPRLATIAKQLGAPASARGSLSVADEPSFPELIGLAFDSNLVKLQDSVFTLDLNAFAFRTLARPAILDRQSLYGSAGNTLLRRFGGAISFGGKGDRFDRDGDGSVDEPLTAELPTEIVTFEVRARVVGSRDRRDDGPFQRYVSRVLQPDQDLNDAIAAFLISHDAEIRQMSVLVNPADPAAGRTPDTALFAAFLERPEIAAELVKLARTYQTRLRANQEALRDLDHAMVWTAVVGGTRQAAKFGPDRLKVALRGVVGTAGIDHTLNLEWSRAERIGAGGEPRAWKAAYQMAGLMLRDSALLREGIKVAVGFNAEHFQNVADVRHDTIVTAGVRVDLPLTRGIIVPISVNYANHRDLLTDERQILGHVGFGLDLSDLVKRRPSN